MHDSPIASNSNNTILKLTQSVHTAMTPHPFLPPMTMTPYMYPPHMFQQQPVQYSVHATNDSATAAAPTSTVIQWRMKNSIHALWFKSLAMMMTMMQTANMRTRKNKTPMIPIPCSRHPSDTHTEVTDESPHVSPASVNDTDNLQQIQLEVLIEAMPKSDSEDEFPMRFYSAPALNSDSDNSLPQLVWSSDSNTTSRSEIYTTSDWLSDGASCRYYTHLVIRDYARSDTSDSDVPPSLVPVSASSSDTLDSWFRQTVTRRLVRSVQLTQREWKVYRWRWTWQWHTGWYVRISNIRFRLGMSTKPNRGQSIVFRILLIVLGIGFWIYARRTIVS